MKKYIVLTITLILGTQQANSMTCLRRFNPALVGASAAAYANYFTQPTQCQQAEKEPIIQPTQPYSSPKTDLSALNSYKPNQYTPEYIEKTHLSTKTDLPITSLAKNTDLLYDLKSYEPSQYTPEYIEELKKSGIDFKTATYRHEPLLWQEDLSPAVFKAIIEAGAEPNAKYIDKFNRSYDNGVTPLLRQFDHLYRAVNLDRESAKKNALEKIDILLSMGIKPTTAGSGGVAILALPFEMKTIYESPIEDSIADSINIKLFRRLLAAGSDPKETDEFKKNALHVLASGNLRKSKFSSDTERAEVITSLLNGGANPWAKNDFGQSPISIAKQFMDCDNDKDRQVYADFIVQAARHNKCSWKRPFEKNITNLSPEETIKQATSGLFRTCTDDGK